ncbi:MAG: hypothetical protein Q9166_005196 [cf. Caloplaca sp. 2 TL-2023]
MKNMEETPNDDPPSPDVQRKLGLLKMWVVLRETDMDSEELGDAVLKAIMSLDESPASLVTEVNPTPDPLPTTSALEPATSSNKPSAQIA